MTLQIADEVTLHLDRPAHGGFCVGRVDGQVVFARYGVPGEDVRLRIACSLGVHTLIPAAVVGAIGSTSPSNASAASRPKSSVSSLCALGSCRSIIRYLLR